MGASVKREDSKTEDLFAVFWPSIVPQFLNYFIS